MRTTADPTRPRWPATNMVADLSIGGGGGGEGGFVNTGTVVLKIEGVGGIFESTLYTIPTYWASQLGSKLNTWASNWSIFWI